MKHLLTLVLVVCLYPCLALTKPGEYIPAEPDYDDPAYWYTNLTDKDGTGGDIFYIVSTWIADYKTPDSIISHWADAASPAHQELMKREIGRVASYIPEGNNFYSPYYRHMSINPWMTLDEELIDDYLRPAMRDVRKAFDHFIANRPAGRPFVIAGFSQGGRAVVELLKYMPDSVYEDMAAAYVLGYKVTPQDIAEFPRIKGATGEGDTGVTICYNTVKDTAFVKPVVAAPCAICINPVNWHTDATEARLNDTITIAVSPEHHVLVAKGYDAKEYKPIMNYLNIGDIHGCEPWLYKDFIYRNMDLRLKNHRKAKQSL